MLKMKPLSTNPVQKNWQNEIESVLLPAIDDIYDFANAIAILTKYTDALKKEMAEAYSDLKPQEFIAEAMVDWKKKPKPTLTRIPVKDLKPGYHLFGNKGTVWENKAHIAKDGMYSDTLCGVPMLSNNWAKIEKVEEVGCIECIKIYKEQNP